MTLLVHLLLYPSEITDTQTRNSNLILISDYQSDYRSVTNSLLLWVRSLFTYYHCTSIDYSVLCEWITLYCEYTVPDITKFTYYHCTSIDYSVLCEWSTLYCEYTVPDITKFTYYHCTYTLLWLVGIA